MGIAKVTSKGQITIPKDVRERLGIRAGDELEFVEEDGVFRIRKCARLAALDRYEGYLQHLAGKTSDELVEEMRGR